MYETAESAFKHDAMALLEIMNVIHTSNACMSRAYIAGGAVRDLLLGAPIKDVDLLIENVAGSRLIDILRTTFNIPTLVDKTDEDYPYENEFIKRVLHAENCNGFPMDLILLQEGVTGLEMVSVGFDIDLCKAWMNTMGDIDFYDCFKNDVKDKVIRISKEPKDGDEASSFYRHAKRIQKKYPHFGIVDNHGFCLL